MRLAFLLLIVGCHGTTLHLGVSKPFGPSLTEIGQTGDGAWYAETGSRPTFTVGLSIDLSPKDRSIVDQHGAPVDWGEFLEHLPAVPVPERVDDPEGSLDHDKEPTKEEVAEAVMTIVDWIIAGGGSVLVVLLSVWLRRKVGGQSPEGNSI